MCHCRYQADQAERQAADTSMSSQPEQTTEATVAESSGVSTAVPTDASAEHDQELHQKTQSELHETNVNTLAVPTDIVNTESTESTVQSGSTKPDSTNDGQSHGFSELASPTPPAHTTVQFLQLSPIQLVLFYCFIDSIGFHSFVAYKEIYIYSKYLKLCNNTL